MRILFPILTVSSLLVSILRAEDFSKALPIIEKSTVLIKALGDDKSESIGTGFFINGRGLMITNAHVIENASCALIQLQNGSIASVTSVKAIYPGSDIAFLETSLTETQSLELLNSDQVKKGSAVGVLGNPKGFEFSLSTGIVSGIRREGNHGHIQFTAPVSPGSSGSPIFNTDGKVIGIVTFGIKDAQNLNFGVDGETITQLLDRAEKQPQVKWKRYDPFRDSVGPSQSEMTIQAISDYDELEELHQKIYDDIILIYGKDSQTVEFLRKGQRAWIAYRDAHIRSIWPEIETGERMGSAERMCISFQLESLTRDRVQQLLTWREGMEEGHVDAGTRMTPEAIKARERALQMDHRK